MNAHTDLDHERGSDAVRPVRSTTRRGAARSRRHVFQISIRMDKPCSEKIALREVRDTIHGIFFTTQFEECEPGQYRVLSIRRPKAGRKSP